MKKMGKYELRAYEMHCLLKFHGKSELSQELSEWWYKQSIINRAKDKLFSMNLFFEILLFPLVIYFGMGLDKKSREHDKLFKDLLKKHQF